jgi:DNA-binding transcriptional LysR family regulator
MERGAKAIDRAAEGSRTELEGSVTISAPPTFAAAMLARPLVAMRKRHPGIRICILGETRSASLDRREADIAIRLSRPTDGDLIVVKLTELSFQLCGSAAYLSQTSPGDWVLIGYDESMDVTPQQAALIKQMAGRSIGFRASTLEIQHALVRESGGVAMLPDFMAGNDSALMLAAPDQPPVMRDVWLVSHPDMKGSAVVRAVVNAVREDFGLMP